MPLPLSSVREGSSAAQQSPGLQVTAAAMTLDTLADGHSALVSFPIP